MATVGDFREWKPEEWFDRGFLQLVPAPVRDDFLRAFRPLHDDFSSRVSNSLFAGIKQPFHFTNANGWMARLLRTECPLPDTASFEQREKCMRSKLPWALEDIVLLVYQQPTAYAGSWGEFLRHFRKDRINLDTVLICHPKSREIILFWEDRGPMLGKRGHRDLPAPSWDEL